MDMAFLYFKAPCRLYGLLIQAVSNGMYEVVSFTLSLPAVSPSNAASLPYSWIGHARSRDSLHAALKLPVTHSL